MGCLNCLKRLVARTSSCLRPAPTVPAGSRVTRKYDPLLLQGNVRFAPAPFPPPSFYSVVLVLASSSYLGCLAPFIYVYGCLSCPTHIICDCPGLFCFCPLFPS